ncbi:MAG: hypothetical protein JRJ87_12850 [Deltaproteobacteria bacterium]|nr:hypothetical protein [Deltaproteobacteria bacterium]
MQRILRLTLATGLALLVVNCSSSEPEREKVDPKKQPVSVKVDQISGTGNRVQVPLGEKAAPWGKLTFTIVKVHKYRAPTKTAPWHAAGGQWTVFDCRLLGGIPFLVGIKEGPSNKSGFSFGKAFIVVDDSATGKKIVERFARAFHTPVPRAKQSNKLRLYKFSIAILGKNIGKLPGGGYGGQGNWVATKLFPEKDGIQAEVFFNFDPVGLQGEFSEKDPMYREDLLTLMAVYLRDGPLPPRTPETDPNLSKSGPRFGDWIKMTKEDQFFSFTAGGLMLMATRDRGQGSRVYTIDPKSPRDSQRTIIELKGAVQSVHCFDKNAERCIVIEGIHQEAGVWKSNDEAYLWWVDRKAEVFRRIEGPWSPQGLYLLGEAISPDQHYLVISQWDKVKKGSKSGSPTGARVFIHDIRAKTTKVIKTEKTLSVVKWQGRGKKQAVILGTGGSWDPPEKRKMFAANLQTGQLKPAGRVAVPDEGFSPSGKLSLRIEGGRLVIEDLKTKKLRIFDFHPDDLRFVEDEDPLSWVNDRYLLFYAARQSLIDLKTMKMSYLFEPGEDKRSLQFSSDLKWAVTVEDGVPAIGRVVLPGPPL